jgi:MoxR-like ATPase
MLDRFKAGKPMDALSPVATGADIIGVQGLVENVHVDSDINDMVVSIVSHTRNNADVQLGASPRAGLCLLKAAQAWAFYGGYEYVSPDDVAQMAPHVLPHRILLRQEATVKKVRVADIIDAAVNHSIDITK